MHGQDRLGPDRYRVGMSLLETRELRYFVAVAEELHFGRAARRLSIAQPPLSRAIKQLEHRLGVALLDRSGGRVALTAAGITLFEEGRLALAAVEAAATRTRRAGQPRLILAIKAGIDGGLLPEILSVYGREPGALPVEMLVGGYAEQSTAVRAGRADLALVHGRAPDLQGLDSAELFIEPQVAVLPPGHRLAGHAKVCLADLAGEPMPACQPLQLMQLIALGRAVAVVPESVRNQIRRDLACVPVVDAAPTPVLLAWPQGSRSRDVATFVRAAATVAAAA
jgi:DNA-binding transcriptional LysR family regulator